MTGQQQQESRKESQSTNWHKSTENLLQSLIRKTQPSPPKKNLPPNTTHPKHHPTTSCGGVSRNNKKRKTQTENLLQVRHLHGLARKSWQHNAHKELRPRLRGKQQAVNADKESGENDGRINSSISQNDRFSPHLTVIYLINGCIFNFIF